MYLYPNPGSGGSTIGYNPSGGRQTRGEQGEIVQGNCNTSTTLPKYCNVTINLNEKSSNNTYYLRLKPLYQRVFVHIDGLNAGNVPQKLKDSQAIVDVTGRAQDVLRRIQVRIPIGLAANLQNFDGFPSSALESTQGICKLIQVGRTIKNDCEPDAPDPPPDPDPGADNGDGNAHIIGLGNNDTDTGGTNGNNGGGGNNSTSNPYRWSFTFENQSNNDPAIVDGCVWDWGDGTKTINQKCEYGDRITHQFPNLEPVDIPQDCKAYHVTLTVNFNNSFRPQTDTWIVRVPQGPKGQVDCKNQYR